MKTKDIRQTFIKYFQRQGHDLVPSGPLIPENDPTLLFTNAGMNQFKNTFLGLQEPPLPTSDLRSKMCPSWRKT